jgi:hypothetical protein
MKYLFTVLTLCVGVAFAQGPQIPLTGSVGVKGSVAILGSANVAIADANHTLTANEYASNFLLVTSSVSLTATRNLVGPLNEGQQFTIENSTTGGHNIQIIGATGTGITIPNGQTVSVTSDGTNYLTAVSSGGTPGGSDAQIQINNSSAFGAITNAAPGSVLASQGTSTASVFQTKPTLDVRDWGNGSTNGIASAVTACGSVNPCTILIPSSYPATESVPCGILTGNGGGGCSTSSNITFLDLRTGGTWLTANNPQGNNPSTNFRPFQEWINAYSAALPQSPVGINLVTLAAEQKSYFGGYNFNSPATSYVNKTNWAPFQWNETSYTPGQHILHTNTLYNLSVGDSLAIQNIVTCAGGFNAGGDEGCEAEDNFVSQLSNAVVGSISSGGAANSTSLVLSISSGGGSQGAGRFLINTTSGKTITSGTVSSYTSPAPTSPPVLTGSGTSWPVSTVNTTLGTAVTAPGSATVTPGSMTGISTSTMLCVADAANFELLYPSATGGSTFTAMFAKPHPAVAIVAAGGLCGYGIEMTADRVSVANTLRLLWPVIVSTSSTSATLWVSSQGGYSNYVGNWSASRDGYVAYPLAEVTSVAIGGSLSATLTLSPNRVNWANSDTVEEPLYPEIKLIQGNNVYTKYFPSSSSQRGYVHSDFLTGLWGSSDSLFYANNQTSDNYYDSSYGGNGSLGNYGPPVLQMVLGNWSAGQYWNDHVPVNGAIWNAVSGKAFNIFDSVDGSGSDTFTFDGPNQRWGWTVGNGDKSLQFDSAGITMNVPGCTAGTYVKGDDTGCGTPAGGLADPGTNGLVFRSATNVTTPATYPEVTGLFNCATTLGFLDSNGSCNPNVFLLSNYAPQTSAFFARLATQPTSARAAAYDTLITELVGAGIWAKLDGLYVYAAADAPTALTNLVQSSYGQTAVGSPTFSANTGYTGANGSAKYLDTNFNPATASLPQFTQNSSSLFALRTASPSGDAGGLAGVTGGAFQSYLAAPLAGNVPFNGSVTGHTVGGGLSHTPLGLFMASRLSASTETLYENGVAICPACSSTSATPSSVDVITLNDGTSGADGTTGTVAAAGMGAGLTQPEAQTLTNYLQNYLTTVSSGSTLGTPLYTQQITSTAGLFNYGFGLARLVDGRLLANFGQNSGTLNTDGNQEYSISSDNGRSWSAPVVYATPPTGYSYTDSSVTALPNGSMALVATKTVNGDAYPFTVVVFNGTVASGGAITLSSPYTITTALTNPTTASFILRLANGTLMLPMYNNNEGEITVEFSSDSGSTWGSETQVVNVSVTGNNDLWGESNFVQLQSGLCFGILRNDNTSNGSRRGWWTVSSTNTSCTAWGSPTQIFNQVNPSRPAIAMDASGNLFAVGRFNGAAANNETGYTYSLDAGVTWSSVAIINDFISPYSRTHAYAQGFWDQLTNSFLYDIGNFVYTYSGAASLATFQQFSPIVAPSASLVPIKQGGTGTSTPGLVQGSNVTITGAWPNQTISATSGGGGGNTLQVAGVSLASTDTVNFNATVPTAPSNGYNITFATSKASSTDSVSGALVGDGNTSHFLRGDGTFNAPSGSSTTSFQFGSTNEPLSATAPTTSQYLQWNGTNIVGATPSGTSRTTILGACGGAVQNNASGITVDFLGGNVGNGQCGGSSGSKYGTLLTHACTLQNLYVHVGTASSTSGDGVITVQDGASATSITCTLGTANNCNDTSHTYSASAGDMIWVIGATNSTAITDVTVAMDCM